MLKTNSPEALTTLGDFNSLWLTAHACATTVASLKWISNCRLSHEISNDLCILTLFIQLPFAIVIQLRHNNLLPTIPYGFLVVIQSYQVNTVRTPTLRCSPLWFNSFCLGWHIIIVWNGKCSITSVSSCTLAQTLIHGIYIPFHVPPNQLLTTARKSIGESLHSTVLITESWMESSEQVMVHFSASQVHYTVPYKILHWFGTHMHDATYNERLYVAPLNNQNWYGCYANRQICGNQHHRGEYGPRSESCKNVGYSHDGKKL